MTAFRSKKRANAAQAAAEAMAAGASLSQIKTVLETSGKTGGKAQSPDGNQHLSMVHLPIARAQDKQESDTQIQEAFSGLSLGCCVQLPIEILTAILDASAPDCSALDREGSCLSDRRKALARTLQHRQWLKTCRLVSKSFDAAVKLQAFWSEILPHAQDTTHDHCYQLPRANAMDRAEDRLRKGCVLCWRNGINSDHHVSAKLLQANETPLKQFSLPLAGLVTVHDLLYDPSIGDMGRNSIMSEQARSHSMCSVCFVSDGDPTQSDNTQETAYGYSGRMYIYDTHVATVDPIQIYPAPEAIGTQDERNAGAVSSDPLLGRKGKTKGSAASNGGKASGYSSPAPPLDPLRAMVSSQALDVQASSFTRKPGKYPLCHRCRTRLLDAALNQSPIFLIFTSMFDLWRSEVTRRTRALHGLSSVNSVATSSTVSRQLSKIATPITADSGATTPSSASYPMPRDSAVMTKDLSTLAAGGEAGRTKDIDLSILTRSGTAEIDERLTKLAQGSAWTKMYWLREDWVANAHAPRAKFGSGGDGKRTEGVGSVVGACEQAMLTYIDLE